MVMASLIVLRPASEHRQGARQSRVEEPYKLESASRGANRRLSDSSSRKPKTTRTDAANVKLKYRIDE